MMNSRSLDAWAASASRLSELVADFKLIADLSVTTGGSKKYGGDSATEPSITRNCLTRRRQISGPTVQTIGVAVETNLASSLTPRGSLSPKEEPGRRRRRLNPGAS